MREIYAVLFDMDGLLVDSERPNLECSVALAKTMGFELDMLALARKVMGSTRNSVLDNYRAALPEFVDAEAFFHEKNRMFRARMEKESYRPMKGAETLLKWLKQQGITCVLATSTPYDRAMQRLADVGLSGMLDHILTGDMVQNGKPAPDCFLKAASMANVAPQHCLVLEDSFNGVRAGRAAGAIVGMVPDVLPFDDTFAPYCDVVFEDLEQVIGWIAET